MQRPERSRARRTRCPCARSRGQALTEFALILPVFLLMTLGVVDFSRLFTSYITLINGVREGVLYAAEGDRTIAADYIAHVQARVKTETDAGDLTWANVTPITIQCTTAATLQPPPAWTACADGATPKFVRLSATYQLDLATPFFGTMTMTNTTTTVVVR